MKTAVLIARSALGLIYLSFGLDFFLHFISHIVNIPPLDDQANSFLGALAASKYFFPFLKTIEIIFGLFLLTNRNALLAVIALFPVTVNIFLFHAYMAQPVLLLGSAMLVFNLFLIFAYRKYYAALFMVSPQI